MVQYWSHSRRSFRSSRARARFSTTLYIVQIRLTAPNLVQICEGIADGTSVTARRRSVLLQPSERHSPPSPVPAVPTACFPPRPQAKAMPTARLRPLARALHTALPFALRAKWARQCHAAEHDAFFAPPGIASPSAQNGRARAAPRSASPSSLRSGIASPTAQNGCASAAPRSASPSSPSAQNGCASAAPQNASPSSPRLAWLRPPRPCAALPSSISGASRRCAIYSNRRSAPSSVSRRIEKYPPPKISGPGEPSVPVPSLRLRPCSGGAADSLPHS